jgi:predicted nuclease of restriction endonuclease-like (RecB) superfamily
MRQFYETYRGDEKVSALLRQLPWTHNLLILGKSKRAEEREFYLRMATAEKWSSRELQRQINGALFERVVMSPTKVSPLLNGLASAKSQIIGIAWRPNVETIFSVVVAQAHIPDQ